MGQKTRTTTLKIGDKAPNFELPNQHGDVIRLADFAGKRVVVLYFYPKDDTPGCTAESCSFRDHFEDFSDAGAQVIGISADSIESHARFAERHRLPFLLLSDVDGLTNQRYGVTKTLGLIPGRVTFVIDRAGIIRDIFESQFSPEKHIQNALDIIKIL